MLKMKKCWPLFRNRRVLSLKLVVSLSLAFLTIGVSDCDQAGPRPESWAQPVKLAGVSNLYKVSDLLYRCAQPTASGFRELEKQGIKTVVNLRSEHSDQNLLAGTNLKYYEIPSKATRVQETDLLKFLQIVTNPEEGPYLVHCHHGADRTGLFVAVYRVVVQNWPREEAIKEMQKGGFGFHNTYTNIVKYLQTFDPEKFRRALKNRDTLHFSEFPDSLASLLQSGLKGYLIPGQPEIIPLDMVEIPGLRSSGSL